MIQILDMTQKTCGHNFTNPGLQAGGWAKIFQWALAQLINNIIAINFNRFNIIT